MKAKEELNLNLNIDAISLNDKERSNDKEILNDILDSIKKTIFGKIYLQVFKKIPFIRMMVLLLWRTTLPIYLQYKLFFLENFHREQSKSIIRLNQLQEDMFRNKYNFFSISLVKTPVPILYPVTKQGRLISPHTQYEFPEITLLELEKAQVHGGTNLVTKKNFIIAHDLFEFDKDYTSEELHARLYIKPKKNTAVWLTVDEEPEHVDTVATFIDACAQNYAHWLTEVFPKIVLFCNDPRFKSIPIVINDGLHHNLLKSLSLVVGSERKVITLPIGRSLNVQHLFTMSSIGYVPFDRRNKKFKYYSHGKFSPDAFQIVRNTILDTIPQKKYYDKIYVRRNSKIRNIINSDEIENYLVSRGFTIIEPENLTFTEQATIFNYADIVIGASGAALANIIFCKKGVQIIIFLPDISNNSFWYWQNIACATENKVEYVLGQVKTKKEGIHSSYFISLKDLASTTA